MTRWERAHYWWLLNLARNTATVMVRHRVLL